MNFTIKNKPELCSTCIHSHIMETRNEVITMCRDDHPSLRVYGVVKCNEYSPFTNSTEPWEYKDAAWIIEIKNNKVGFKPPNKKEDK